MVDTVFFQPWFQSTIPTPVAAAAGVPVVTYQVDSGGREDSSINDMLTPGFCDECSKLTAGRCAQHTPQIHIGDPFDPFTPFVPRVFIAPPTVLRVGWRCPDCRRCYAPDVVACTRCGPQDPEPSLGQFSVTGK